MSALYVEADTGHGDPPPKTPPNPGRAVPTDPVETEQTPSSTEPK